jgi:hypothetical protein
MDCSSSSVTKDVAAAGSRRRRHRLTEGVVPGSVCWACLESADFERYRAMSKG